MFTKVLPPKLKKRTVKISTKISLIYRAGEAKKATGMANLCAENSENNLATSHRRQKNLQAECDVATFF